VYRANRQYALIGGALSNAGDVHEWCRKRLRLEEAEIETKLAAGTPDSHGLTVLPFFSGERSTGWHDSARATFTGISLSTQPIDLVRASLEAVCYRFAAIYERLKDELASNARIIASGGGILHSRAWTQIMSDVIGVPVAASGVAEASSRGAAMPESMRSI
jgi:gluconokinase